MITVPTRRGDEIDIDLSINTAPDRIQGTRVLAARYFRCPVRHASENFFPEKRYEVNLVIEAWHKLEM